VRVLSAAEDALPLIIKPHEIGLLTFKIEPLEFPKDNPVETVTVFTDSPKQAQAILTIRATK
jgi:hypothetical protein